MKSWPTVLYDEMLGSIPDFNKGAVVANGDARSFGYQYCTAALSGKNYNVRYNKIYCRRKSRK